jgi:hypothetical protein
MKSPDFYHLLNYSNCKFPEKKYCEAQISTFCFVPKRWEDMSIYN